MHSEQMKIDAFHNRKGEKIGVILELLSSICLQHFLFFKKKNFFLRRNIAEIAELQLVSIMKHRAWYMVLVSVFKLEWVLDESGEML